MKIGDHVVPADTSDFRYPRGAIGQVKEFRKNSACAWYVVIRWLNSNAMMNETLEYFGSMRICTKDEAVLLLLGEMGNCLDV